MTDAVAYISKDEIWKLLNNLASETDGKASFIFGAGASYGYSDDSSIYSAPIVKNLFDANHDTVREVLAYSQHESLRDNMAHIQKKIRQHGDDLEKYLSALYKGSSDDSLFANILNYLQDVFYLSSRTISKTSNHYMTLLNEIADLNRAKTWPLISFNYDTLLEKSYLAIGRDRVRGSQGFNSLESYTNAHPVILKMHGSINFRYRFIKPFRRSDEKNPRYSIYNLFAEMMDEQVASGDFTTGLTVMNPSDSKPAIYNKITDYRPGTRIIEEQSVFDFPLMLIPIHASIAPENHFFQDMTEHARREIENSKLIVAIGYNFADEAFVNALTTIDFKDKQIVIIGSKESAADIRNHRAVKSLKSVLKNVNIRVFNGDGFKEFVE